MAKVERIEVARAERRYGDEIADAFASTGSAVARVEDTGDAELWRAVARKVARAGGHRVHTGYHEQHGVVGAVLVDLEVTEAEVRAAGERLSELLLGPRLEPHR